MNREQLLNSMLHEIRVAKHLYGQLPAGCADWRPSPGQRSTLELLRYLTYCGIGVANAVAAGNFGPVKAIAEKAKAMPFEFFPAAMDAQAEGLKKLISGISDAEYAERVVELMPMGKGTVCEMLANTSLKFLAAYRMQLFLYAKMNGAAGLDTWDCWRGQTNPQKAAGGSTSVRLPSGPPR